MNPNIISVPSKVSKYPEENIGKIFFKRFSSFPKDSIAFVEIKTGEVCTYGNLVARSLSLASNLRKLGVRKNDVLCIISENTHKFWVTGFAAFYLAAPVHFLNPGYTKYELKKFLMMSKPKIIFCSEAVFPKVNSLDLDFIENLVIFDDLDKVDALLYTDLIKEEIDNFDFEEVGNLEQQVAYIANSSGTTGWPKGVMISHENLRLNISHVQDPELFPFDHTSVILHIVPFFHVHGCGICYCGLYQGVKLIIMNQFVPKTYMETIQNQKITILCIVPTLADFLSNTDLTQYDLSSVKEIYSAAGALHEFAYNTILKKFNLKTIREIYGLTEMACAIFLTPILSNKIGSSGKVVPGYSVKIVNPQTGEILPANQPGEICTKAAAMIGYINDPENTRAAFDSAGFLKTGDIGYYDEDQFFYIVDRMKDLIKYKSFQVPPLEIEDVLLQHSGVKDAAVIGKPDERFGELAVAFVVKKEGVDVNEEKIKKFVAEYVCLEKRLHGGVRFVEGIPRNTLGKILRNELRNLL